MSEAKITLDRETFKALASDTRLDILKLLDQRQMTVSELGRALGLNKATCFEHLSKLVEAGLVNKIEDERKWVYYQLSWKGRRILNPEKITFALLLSSSFAALVTGIVTLWFYVKGHTDVWQEEVKKPQDSGFGTFAAGENAPPPEYITVTNFVQHDAYLWSAVALFVLVLATFALALLAWRKAKARSAA